MPYTDPDVARIEAARKAAKIPAYKLLARAGISSATYWDWINRGVEPLKKTIRRLDAALLDLLREQGIDPDSPLSAPAPPDTAVTPEN